MADYGKFFKKYREAKGLSQTELAERIGVTQQVVSGYEKDFKEPRLDVIGRMADVLDCSVDKLLGRG